MSVRLAAGWAMSRSQAVSVVPMIQCRPPRDHEEHRLLGLGDEAGLGPDPVAGHHQVDALGGVHLERSLAAHHLLDLVGPHAGRVDHDLGPHLQVDAVLQVPGGHPDHPLALAQEAGDLGPGRDVRAVVGRRAGHGHHQPGVVDLAVVVADRAVQVVGAQVGSDPGELLAEHVLVLRHAHVVLAGHRHRVVERHAGADVRALPGVRRAGRGTAPGGPGAGASRVSSRPRSSSASLTRREVEHLQVAQPAVHQLAELRLLVPLARSRCSTSAGAQAAGDRVERRADADDPAAHDQDVELGRTASPRARRRARQGSARSEWSCPDSAGRLVPVRRAPGHTRGPRGVSRGPPRRAGTP